MSRKEISDMTDSELEDLVGWLVGRMHVSCSAKGVKSNIGRKLAKGVKGDDRKRVLEAAVRVHEKNQQFFNDMRF